MAARIAGNYYDKVLSEVCPDQLDELITILVLVVVEFEVVVS